MSYKPTLSVAFSNGNLLQNISAPDGYAALIGTAYDSNNTDKVFIVNSLAEAEAQGLTALAEPAAHRQIKEFYQELAGNMRLYVQLFPLGTMMVDMLDSTDPASASKLVKVAGGDLSVIGVFKAYAPGESGGTAFVDEDAVAAVTTAEAFAQYWQGKNLFFRVLIGANVADETAIDNIYSPSYAEKDHVGMLIGGSLADNTCSVGLALGRKAKYAAHIKLGKVANGSLTLTKAYIGSREIAADGGDMIDAVAEVKATAQLTITNAGAEDDYLSIYIKTRTGWVYLGSYGRTAGDTTATLVATGIQAAINSYTATTGYVATRVGAVVTITQPAGLGSNGNGYEIFVAKTQTTTIAWTKTNFSLGVDYVPAQIFNTDIFHSKGFITYLTYPGKAGFYFGIDHMANTGDYRLLVNGCVVDACAKITNLVYTNELESEVDTAEDGTISEAAAVHLESRITQQVLTTMGERISAFSALVDRTINIINTSRTAVKERIRPKGYLTDIDVDLGLTAGVVA